MNMNRRAFFGFFGRASGTAAAVVVGGAALLPKVKDADIQPDGAVVSFVKQSDEWHPMDPLNKIEWVSASPADWKKMQREMMAGALQKSPIL